VSGSLENLKFGRSNLRNSLIGLQNLENSIFGRYSNSRSDRPILEISRFGRSDL
jgi:hypothetical protein